MNDLLATIFTGTITDENERDYFVQKNGQALGLNKPEGEHKINEVVEGFGYQNQKHENRITAQIPKSRVGHYTFGIATTTREDLGAFVDIDLPDKDFVVSLDGLPTMTELWPKKGGRLMISLRVGTKDRVWENLTDERMFKFLSKYGTEEVKNKDVIGTTYHLKLTGTYVLAEDFYLGFIHSSERYSKPQLGEQVKGHMIGARPDGVLNFSPKPRAYETISDDAQMILTILERSADQQTDLTGKSDPEDIMKALGTSRDAFKRTLDNLLKQGLVKQEGSVTKLVKRSN